MTEAAGGIVIHNDQGVTVACLRTTSLLDSTSIETVGKTLYKLIDEQACRKVVIDFHLVNSLSSQMLGLMVSVNKKSKAIGGKVVICGLRPELMKVFKITQLDRILDFAPDESAAIQKFDVLAK